jgi:hypothetical protein
LSKNKKTQKTVCKFAFSLSYDTRLDFIPEQELDRIEKNAIAYVDDEISKYMPKESVHA